jgi:hypothetical protein
MNESTQEPLCHAVCSVVDVTFCGFHGSDDSSLGLLGCDTVQCCSRIPVFQRSMLPPSSHWMTSQPRRP